MACQNLASTLILARDGRLDFFRCNDVCLGTDSHWPRTTTIKYLDMS